jgi:enoyl-CoA hydratase
MGSGISSDRGGGVLRVVLDKPEKLNAVDTPMLVELRDTIAGAAADDSVRAIALTGAGRAFCAGGDVGGKNTAGAGATAAEVIEAITTSPKPVVAGVRGAAVGVGCSLVLACDLAVAAEPAFFQLAFSKIGLMTDGGLSALLPAAIGRARANRMALLAEKISATDAFEWGMISHLAADQDYEREFDEVVDALATGPTVSYGWIKRAMAAGTLTDLEAVHDIETQGQNLLPRTEDFREGVRAFRAGEKPRFQGR